MHSVVLYTASSALREGWRPVGVFGHDHVDDRPQVGLQDGVGTVLGRFVLRLI
jgi:hypothetical protein